MDIVHIWYNISFFVWPWLRQEQLKIKTQYDKNKKNNSPLGRNRNWQQTLPELALRSGSAECLEVLRCSLTWASALCSVVVDVLAIQIDEGWYTNHAEDPVGGKGNHEKLATIPQPKPRHQ